ncbi:hypothetical protein CHH49_04040 [Terribacillus saccharophilus]|uniref:hypothetical protein n=1 Tax=Terribacillus saccharophilus TaxID=361277 RepID=UPI000BA6CED5|nr:hypothetical protein [Terribacillus saccharophilus]PAF22764.1 hypothetical protein CHH49_04040 [Terribacillus saccharophilus]
MNFDSKYLIRWGLPGWVCILYFIYYLFMIDKLNLSDMSKNASSLIGSFIVVFPLGVIVGYLVYQMYFILLWITSTNELRNIKTLNVIKESNLTRLPEKRDEVYYHTEYMWHKYLVMQEEYKMNYISDRYRHLLTKKHEAGSLLTALVFSMPISGALVTRCIWGELSTFDMYMPVLNVVLILYMIRTYLYYHRNVDYFVAGFLKDMIKNKI